MDRITLPLMIIGALLVAACGDDPVRPESVPETHTSPRDGVFHAPGLNQPAANCASCHGENLQGGSDGEPSCFQCHGAVWG